MDIWGKDGEPFDFVKMDLDAPDDVVYLMSPETSYQYWWLSFADPNLPKGSQFLGVAIVEASDFMMAVMQANLLDINPGGEVQGSPVPPENAAYIKDWTNRLLSMEEIKKIESGIE